MKREPNKLAQISAELGTIRRYSIFPLSLEGIFLDCVLVVGRPAAVPPLSRVILLVVDDDLEAGGVLLVLCHLGKVQGLQFGEHADHGGPGKERNCFL